jgi:hypothetical protein
MGAEIKQGSAAAPLSRSKTDFRAAAGDMYGLSLFLPNRSNTLPLEAMTPNLRNFQGE